jgi:hypothetical protein
MLWIIGLSLACSQQPSSTTNQSSTVPPTPLSSAVSPHAAPAGQLTYQAPSEWTSQQPGSSMRVAQYTLPRAAGDTEDASLVVYYFGPGQGGSVEANLERWTNQMAQPDGSPSSQKAATKKMTVNGMNVTLLDVSGTYRAEMTPGAGERHDKSGFRMRAVVIETPAGPYFFKLVGPDKTVARWDGEFMKFVESSRFK